MTLTRILKLSCLVFAFATSGISLQAQQEKLHSHDHAFKITDVQKISTLDLEKSGDRSPVLSAGADMTRAKIDGMVCELRAAEYETPGFVPPPRAFEQIEEQRSATKGCATIEVTYNGFGGNPDAMAAFQYAVDIWESLIVSPVTIRIDATFQPLAPGVLGSAGPVFIYRDFPGAQPGTWYGEALADKIYGDDISGPAIPDIVANFSSTFAWYYGRDGKAPPGTYDFVTVVLHEIGHGLGFFGSAVASGTLGLYGFEGPATEFYPAIYDHFIQNKSKTAILEVDDPGIVSTDLGSFLQSDNLFNSSEAAAKGNSHKHPKVYAPGIWRQGSSYSHWDESTFPNGTKNSMMTPFLNFQEAIHDPGPSTLGMFAEHGWMLGNCDYQRYHDKQPCVITGISLDPLFTPSCDEHGTHYAYFRIEGVDPLNQPVNFDHYKIWIQGKEYKIDDLGYDTYMGEDYLYLGVARIGSCCGSELDVKVQLAPGCYYLEEDVYVAPDCGYEDKIAPELYVPNDTTILLDSLIPPPSYTVIDNCDDVEVTVSAKITEADEGCEFVMVRTFTAVDPCGNETVETQTIYVEDIYAPVITVVNPMLDTVGHKGNLRMYNCDDPQVAMADVYVYDNCPYDVSLETYDILVASDVCDVFGYYRKWKCGYIATDAAGNVAEWYFYVLQYDTVAPELMGVPDDITVECGEDVPEASEVTAEDNCIQGSSIAFSETVEEDSVYSMVITRTWTASDNCGNTSSATQVINVCELESDSMNIQNAIGSSTWIDENADGIRNLSEVGLNEVQVTLYRVEENKDLTEVGSMLSHSLNGQDGQFFFTDLPEATYRVKFEYTNQMCLTAMLQGEDLNTDSDANPFTKMTDEIALGANDLILNIDAGFINTSAFKVEVASFEGQNDECINYLTFNTSAEVGARAFEVQRAYEGLDFETISTLDAKGSPNSNATYEVEDKNARKEATYRVMMVDMEGQVTYSDEVQLSQSCRIGTRGVFVFPNPTIDDSSLGFTLPRDMQISLRITDNLGRVVRSIDQVFNKGKHQMDLGLDVQPVGLYWININFEGEMVNKAIVKTE